MSLRRLLELNRELVRPEAHESLDLAERIWIARGSPEDPEELAEALEVVLQRCVNRGINYAPILLKRKKQLESGQWKPRTGDPPAHAVPGTPASASMPGACPHCNGSGWYQHGGMGHLCPCRAWLSWGKTVPVGKKVLA